MKIQNYIIIYERIKDARGEEPTISGEREIKYLGPR